MPPPDWGAASWSPLCSLSLCQGISPEGATDPDGGLSLEEFSRYLQEREQRLLLMFHSLDRNQDGNCQPAGWGWGQGLEAALLLGGEGCSSL